MKARPDELAVYFISEKEIADMHDEFFDDPSSTDCISFPIDDSFLGEIFVCPRVACDRLLKQSEELTETPYQETTLYLIHGLLHLLGYNDIDPDDRKKMEAVQERLLSELIQKNLLLSP